MRVGIFGGSFNPIHWGHYQMGRWAMSEVALKRLIIVPAYQNPLKTTRPEMPDSLRLAMVQATFEDMPLSEVSDFEIRRGQKSYTIDTLEHYKNMDQNIELYLILGQDVFAELNQWHCFENITKLARFIVFHRKGMPQLELPPWAEGFKQRIHNLQKPIPQISSSMIRSMDLDQVERLKLLPPKAMTLWRQYQT